MHMIPGLSRPPGTPTQTCSPEAQSSTCLSQGQLQLSAVHTPSPRHALDPALWLHNRPPANLGLPSNATQDITPSLLHHSTVPPLVQAFTGGRWTIANFLLASLPSPHFCLLSYSKSINTQVSSGHSFADPPGAPISLIGKV